MSKDRGVVGGLSEGGRGTSIAPRGVTVLARRRTRRGRGGQERAYVGTLEMHQVKTPVIGAPAVQWTAGVMGGTPSVRRRVYQWTGGAIQGELTVRSEAAGFLLAQSPRGAQGSI